MPRGNGPLELCLLAVQERFQIAEVAAERERCAKIAIEAKRNHSRSGPTFVNGWNRASDYIEAKIRGGE